MLNKELPNFPTSDDVVISDDLHLFIRMTALSAHLTDIHSAYTLMSKLHDVLDEPEVLQTHRQSMPKAREAARVLKTYLEKRLEQSSTSHASG